MGEEFKIKEGTGNNVQSEPQYELTNGYLNTTWLDEDGSERFEHLYKIMYRRLYLVARNYLMDEDLADDVVQEVFMGLWNKRRKMTKKISLERYLYTSVKNLCVDYHRKLHIIDRYQKHLKETDALIFLPYEEEEPDRESRVMDIMKKLPDMQRQVLELRVVGGLKYREVAAQLCITEETVHTHMKRAYKYIKKNFA